MQDSVWTADTLMFIQWRLPFRYIELAGPCDPPSDHEHDLFDGARWAECFRNG